LDRQITVVVPENAAPPKVEALKRQGVDLVQTGDTYQAAEDYALALKDVHYLSPYNDPDVIAGQATIGFELEQQAPGPITVVCGVGGGGLASGLGLWASRYRDARIIGVEAAVSTAVSSAIEAGHDVQVPVGDSIADGITGNIERGTVTVGLIEQHVHQLVTVTEQEIHDAVRYLATRRGIIAEGAGAAPVAAILNNRIDGRGQPIAVVSGRNIALPTLAEILGN
ncbi:MAG: pyridoxal-phosphate dependent enzyme, partial [Kibdelosporangium sp.]